MPSPTAAVAAAAAAAGTKASEHNPAAPQPPRVLYRLAAVVCHYGQHSFGHYVCFRRRPRGAAGHVGPPRLDEGFSAVPGRGWLRASDDAVREVGIETVLQEESGAFMLYYERVRNENMPPEPAWSSSHPRAVTNDDDDDAGEIDSGGNGQEEKALTVKCESGEDVEMEEAPVIKARVVRSVSLGRGDVFEGASVSVKEVKVEKEDGNPDSDARLLRPSSPAPAKPGHVKVEHEVESLPTSAVSAEAPSPIPDAPAVDEPPIRAVPQSVDR